MGRGWGRPLDLVLGGWNVNYIVSMHSGFPITFQSTDRSGGQLARGTSRPNRYKSLTYTDQTIDRWFGTGNTFCLQAGLNDGACAYGEPVLGTFGNSAKATEHAPDFRNLDFGVGKKFSITENHYLDFRVELFNAFNHPSFAPPARNISAPATFGFITGTISPSRNIEFALKYYF